METEERRVYLDKHLEEVLSRISMKNSVLDFKWEFKYSSVEVLSISGPDRLGWLLWAEFERPDIVTGQVGIGRGRDEIIWEGTTESGVIKTAWVVLKMLVEHELMEAFKVDGKRPFNPHNTIESLNSLEESKEDTYQISIPQKLSYLNPEEQMELEEYKIFMKEK
jgi:hypothetical protein